MVIVTNDVGVPDVGQKSGGERKLQTISVLAMTIAAILTAINQISIVITAKQLWLQQQQLQQQLEKLQKERSE